MLPLQDVQPGSLVIELRSQMPHGATKKEKKRKKERRMLLGAYLIACGCHRPQELCCHCILSPIDMSPTAQPGELVDIGLMANVLRHLAHLTYCHQNSLFPSIFEILFHSKYPKMFKIFVFHLYFSINEFAKEEKRMNMNLLGSQTRKGR